MSRKAFYSFHYKPDNWRASQVRNMGAIEGNQPVSDNDWETVTKGGDAAIKKWIAEQMKGRTCVVVLIGTSTAGRRWITHEILEGWNAGMGVLGIHVHGLKDCDSKQCAKGSNPLSSLMVGEKKLSEIALVYDPPYTESTDVYDYIKKNLESWVEEAIKIRGNLPAASEAASSRTAAFPPIPVRPNKPAGFA